MDIDLIKQTSLESHDLYLDIILSDMQLMYNELRYNSSNITLSGIVQKVNRIISLLDSAGIKNYSGLKVKILNKSTYNSFSLDNGGIIYAVDFGQASLDNIFLDNKKWATSDNYGVFSINSENISAYASGKDPSRPNITTTLIRGLTTKGYNHDRMLPYAGGVPFKTFTMTLLNEPIIEPSILYTD